MEFQARKPALALALDAGAACGHLGSALVRRAATLPTGPWWGRDRHGHTLYYEDAVVIAQSLTGGIPNLKKYFNKLSILFPFLSCSFIFFSDIYKLFPSSTWSLHTSAHPPGHGGVM